MHPQRKQRLLTVLFIVIASSAAIGLMVYALSQNLNLFYPPTQIASGEAPRGPTVRGGGCVVPGSVERATDSLKVKFDITDGKATVSVKYEGLLPDLFDEGEAAVVTGVINQAGVFEAVEVLAKHDETYTPPEVENAMNDGEEHQKTCEGLDYAS